jgi:predicted RNA binding protein with dsRBD fold (UPF0201 family)
LSDTPDDKKARNAAYHAANAEKIRASKRAYRAANAEKIKARKRAYYLANLERLLAAQKARDATRRAAKKSPQ